MTDTDSKTDRRGLLIAGAAALGAGAILGSVGEARANQPYMRAALEALRSAQENLQRAEHDKAGHRANALHLVNEAIGEVQAGIAAGG